MIISTGIDIVENKRIEKLFRNYHEKFVRRFLQEDELLPYNGPRLIQFLAGRWAAKEAFWKAANLEVFFSPLDIKISSGNKPSVEIYSKKVKEKLEEMKVDRIHLSISHEEKFTVAIVIFEGG